MLEHLVALEGTQLCDFRSGVELPGQRPFSVAEYIGTRLHHRHRWGDWIVVLRDYAEADAPFKHWCVSNCYDQIADGFRFRPQTWGRRCSDELDIIFLPEFDDPRPSVREMAYFERERRSHRVWVTEAEHRRNECLRKAAQAGLTRRQAAAMLRLSVGRVQGLVAADVPDG